MEREEWEAGINKIVCNWALNRAQALGLGVKSRVVVENLTSRHLVAERGEKFRGETEQPGGKRAQIKS